MLPKHCGHKESTCQCRRHKFHPWVRKISWRRKWQPTSVFLPGKFHGQRSLVGYSPGGRKELDMTEISLAPAPRLPHVMLSNILSGKISEMVLALTDHSGETTWKGQLVWRPHTTSYKLLIGIKTYVRLNCSWIPDNPEPQKFGLLVSEGDSGPSLILSTLQQLLFSKWLLSQWPRDDEVKDLEVFMRRLVLFF